MKKIHTYVILIGLMILSSACGNESDTSTSNLEKLVIEQNSLIELQEEMICEMDHHLQELHGCDLPMYDGDLKYNLDHQTYVVRQLNQSLK